MLCQVEEREPGSSPPPGGPPAPLLLFPQRCPQVCEIAVEILADDFSQSAPIFGPDPSCGPSARSLDSRVRRPRSAARSKPVSRAVRGSRKAKPESQRDEWTKAPPSRRTSGPAAKPRAYDAGQTSVCPAPRRPELSAAFVAQCSKRSAARLLRKCRKVRTFLLLASCSRIRSALGSRVRRPRSAARSKPVSRAVRGSRKAKPESQRDGWTKAPPGRRILGPAASPPA